MFCAIYFQNYYGSSRTINAYFRICSCFFPRFSYCEYVLSYIEDRTSSVRKSLYVSMFHSQSNTLWVVNFIYLFFFSLVCCCWRCFFMCINVCLLNVDCGQIKNNESLKTLFGRSFLHRCEH